MARKPINSGRIFGFLTVTGQAEDRFDKNGKRFYSVTADCCCGRTITVREGSLKSGNTKSCGCFQREHAKKGIANKRHGLCYSRTYNIWRVMNQRCGNPNATGYEFWGGRGIAVCERWTKFENFLADMGECPPSLSIDRINNDGDYEPGNCRWANRRMQSENTSQVILVTLDGESMSTTAALKKLGKSAGQALDRMKRKGETRQQAIDYYASMAASQ